MNEILGFMFFQTRSFKNNISSICIKIPITHIGIALFSVFEFSFYGFSVVLFQMLGTNHYFSGGGGMRNLKKLFAELETQNKLFAQLQNKK